MAYVCATCGKEHADWPPDLAFQRPDVVWRLPARERAARSSESDDLCVLEPGGDDARPRYFIRGVLLVPMSRRRTWGIGLWAEVSRRSFAFYRAHYHADGRALPRFPGRLSNGIDGLSSLGRRVQVQLGRGQDRPTFWCAEDARHALATLQRKGVSDAALHALLSGAAPGLLR